MLLLALWLAGLLAGQDLVRALATDLAELLPRNLGAEDAGRFLADAGTTLGPWRALAALVPATLYGEGLVRAFDRLSDRGDQGRRSLRGRLGSLAIVAVSPLLLLVGLLATRALTTVLGGAYGGSTPLAAAAVTLGWLYLLHLVVLVGYVLTLQVDARAGRPLAVRTEPHAVRVAA